MVNVNGNTITIALGIIAAVLVIGSIVALLIKDCRHKRRHRDEEKFLDAETDIRSIELPSRGFSLLRSFNRAGNLRPSGSPKSDSTFPSRRSSILRHFSRASRWRSRTTPISDLESQDTAYRTPSATEIRENNWTRADRFGDDLSKPGLQTPGIYESRGQQWSRVSLNSPRTNVDSPGREDSHLRRVSEEEISPSSPDLQQSGDISLASTADWRTEVDSDVPQQRRPQWWSPEDVGTQN